MKRKTLEEFIENARRIHGDKYDYSEAKYETCDTKIKIICPKHGEFMQTPYKHLKGQGCPYCGKTKKLTLEVFKKKSADLYGEKYDLAEVDYVNMKTKVKIICHEKDENGTEHGGFLIKPSSFLSGHSCPKCNGGVKFSFYDFLKKANFIHNEKYQYFEETYVNYTSKTKIVCPEHGEFWQTPRDHLQGHRCPMCAKEIAISKLSITFSEFLEKAKKIHGDEYAYDEKSYEGYSKQMRIICKTHGEFWQKPFNHMKGHGCPMCSFSKMEKQVKNIFERLNITYEPQKKFDWLKYINKLSLDYYLPDYNIAIECQGKQHFEPVEPFGGEKEFKKLVERDACKKRLCEENGVILKYINYNEDVEEALHRILDEAKTLEN